MKQRESDLLKSCLELLAIKKIFAYRQNSGAFKTDRGGFYKFASISGLSDIVAVISGKYIAIECKIKSKQSDSQKEFENNLIVAGGEYWLIKNIDELLNKLKELK